MAKVLMETSLGSLKIDCMNTNNARMPLSKINRIAVEGKIEYTFELHNLHHTVVMQDEAFLESDREYWRVTCSIKAVRTPNEAYTIRCGWANKKRFDEEDWYATEVNEFYSWKRNNLETKIIVDCVERYHEGVFRGIFVPERVRPYYDTSISDGPLVDENGVHIPIPLLKKGEEMIVNFEVEWDKQVKLVVATKTKDILAMIEDAMAEEQKIRIMYKDMNRKSSNRIIRPLSVKRSNGIWYVESYCELRKAERTFKVNGMSSCELLGV